MHDQKIRFLGYSKYELQPTLTDRTSTFPFCQLFIVCVLPATLSKSLHYGNFVELHVAA